MNTASLLYIAFALVGFLSFACIAEFLHRFWKIKEGTTRKIAHIASGIFSAYLFSFLYPFELLLLSFFLVFGLFLTKYLKLFRSIHAVSRPTLGEMYFPISLGVLGLFFVPGNILSAQFGILVLGFADAFASLVGEKYGKHEIFIGKHKKTWQGSLAFFISTFILFLIFFRLLTPSSLFFGSLIALLLTLLELFLVFGLDNLFLPLLAGFFLQYLLSLFS